MVAAKELGERLDAFYYAPELKSLRAQLKLAEKQGQIEIKSGADLDIIDELAEADIKKLHGQILKYFEITDVTKYGAIVNWREDYVENLPTRGRLQVHENDIVFAKNNSSRGTTVVIPSGFNGALVTTGFIGIRPKSQEEALLIWSVLSSEAVRSQIYYLAVTASQPEIRQEIFEKEFMLPFPIPPHRLQVIEHAMKIQEAQKTIDYHLRQLQQQMSH